MEAACVNASDLIELCFNGKPDCGWRRVTVRPVSIKKSRHLQVSWYGPKQVIVKNFACGPSAETEVLALLEHDWQSIKLRTFTKDIVVQFSKRGRAMIQCAKPVGVRPVSLDHDRTKDLPIPPNVAHPFLQRIGLQTAEGRTKADMQDKLSQINALLQLLVHTGALDTLQGSRPGDRQSGGRTAGAASSEASSARRGPPADMVPLLSAQLPTSLASDALDDVHEPADLGSASAHGSSAEGQLRRAPLHILDCGCGSAFLTFGIYHYLNHVRGIPAQLSGVDTNAALMARSNQRCQDLGLQATFHTENILDHQPAVRPDLVLALHACDTATDQALALAVQQGALVILAVPCCHQHVHQQLRGAAPVAPFGPLLHHGILKQRLIDLLTDTFRATLLRVVGYQTDCVEFVSSEHTPKNLLIRAVQRDPAPSPAQVRAAYAEYTALRDQWAVQPHLATLLQKQLEHLMPELVI